MGGDVRRRDALPSVSVIVPVRDSRGELTHTLRALASQDYAGEVQVIVVDNGENHDLPGPDSGIAVLEEPVRSSYAARNRGVARATGAVLAFTDADCRPAPDWLSQGVRLLLSQARPSFVGGRIEVEFEPGGRPTGPGLWDHLHGLRQDIYVLRDRYAATANMLVTREVFHSVGAFDGRLRSGGDRDWCTRASGSGVEAVFGPDVVVSHPARNSLAEVQRKILRLHRGSAAGQVHRGQPVFGLRPLLGRLLPHSRSALRASRRLRGDGFSSADRLRYIAAAHWLQYFSLYAWLRAGIEASRRAPDVDRERSG